ncbi:MAG: hypothetical protein FWC01_09965 [Treponema sp.]|nr:hypothetical protein [Treponema sp.]MCL2238272.1 hypothetical protein [Treponema sp.]
MKKKIIVALLILAVTAGSAFAFDPMSAADGIKDSSIFVNLGVGIGGSSFTIVIPPVGGSVDFLLPGALPLSVGAFFQMAIYERSWNGWLGYDKDIYTYMAFGGRVAWHFDFGINNLDTYLGAALGWCLYTYEETFTGNTASRTTDRSFFYYGGFVGARFFFTNNIGVWLEAGYSALTYASLGLALKF